MARYRDHEGRLKHSAEDQLRRLAGGGGAGGTVTSVTGGTGLTAVPDPLIGAGTINLDDTTVTPATYGDSTHVGTFTVDQQGRLTAASNVAIAAAGGSTSIGRTMLLMGA